MRGQCRLRRLVAYGVPEEVLTDNGQQVTDRFGKGGEVLFDRIWRTHGIRHRLTRPASPTTTGKVERMHQTPRRELLDTGEIHPDLSAAQAAPDRWRVDDNTARPHQALDMATPASRFRPTPEGERALLPLELPAALHAVPPPRSAADQPESAEPPAAPDESVVGAPLPAPWTGGPVEFDRVVPASGNMAVAGIQFWLGPARAGLTVTFWADLDVIHLLIAGARGKTVRSHLSVNDLATLATRGGRPAGPPPLPPIEPGAALEADRTLSKAGTFGLGGQILFAEPVTVQRRASNSGIIMVVVGQKISIGRHNARRTVTIHVAEHTITIDHGDGELRTHARTTTQPVTKIKVQRPPKATSVS
ncbi:transposase [Frankia sp. AiPs1]|uniref:integrase core domain-containing protein n=1 Tax=Frankia sp. AiPa1 TaxID=573492 RepID=UPI00202B93CA|nr:integrase core domain-containing protein [Frankia sp. AiPa1]MCL9759046.1 integrase core domain-containing protein [Frankia sp. AiPa1]